MIRVKIKQTKKSIYEISLKGHANYEDYGKDIVCAAVSSITINTVNSILALEETIDTQNDSGYLIIRVIKETDINQKLLRNLVTELEELKSQYPKNIEIRNEE